MLTKILFTALVIAGTLMFFRRTRAPKVRQVKRPIASPPEQDKKKVFQLAAYFFLGFMVIAAVVFTVFDFSSSDNVTVHVINVKTGTKQTYTAEQKNIQGGRFTTIDGRTIYVADVERVEIEAQ